MATPGASRQPLACTMLPHKKPTSLGALLRLAVAVVALYVPRAVPARRLRTSLHLRRAPRRAWTRRGAAPRFSRRLRTPNSLYFMAELTERCGVCAKCQWTCADQPDQTACWMCQNGGGRCYFQHQSKRGKWDLPPCEKPQPAAQPTERCGDCAACQWTCANQPEQPDCRFCRDGGANCSFQQASIKGKWECPPCDNPRTFDFSEMKGVVESRTRQGPVDDEARAKAEADGEAERKRRSEIKQRRDAAKRDATAKYGGKTREETGSKLEGGHVEDASASLRDFDAWVDVGKPMIEPLQGLDGCFFHARDLECMHWVDKAQSLEDFLFKLRSDFAKQAEEEDGAPVIDICRKAEACICLSTVGALCHDQATAAAIECAYGVPLLYNGQVVLLDREAVEGCVNAWIDRIEERELPIWEGFDTKTAEAFNKSIDPAYAFSDVFVPESETRERIKVRPKDRKDTILARLRSGASGECGHMHVTTVVYVERLGRYVKASLAFQSRKAILSNMRIYPTSRVALVERLREFAEARDDDKLLERLAKGVISSSHPNNFGIIELKAHKEREGGQGEVGPSRITPLQKAANNLYFTMFNEGAAAKEMVESFSAKLREDFQRFGVDLDNIQEHLVDGIDVREGFEVFDLVVHAFTDDDGAATRAERHARDHADEMDVFCNEFAVMPTSHTLPFLFDDVAQQTFRAFGVALRARISQLPATCLTWPDPADDDADDLIPDFPPGGGDDEIHVFHHMSSIELENYEA
ncbi:unnamed protein product [Pelagomonas calceolata]|uniref:Uncharacterized protein n=1 Tax=Pelagomonas calceolata TaxID=35677 RepID=A0A8J2X299_9STRA|nr:unnamed protein product [Pelagomonas calceolata]